MPAVVIIWGLIGFQVVSAVNGDDPIITGSQYSVETFIAEKDSIGYELKLSYRDPFEKVRKKESNKPIAEKETLSVKKAEVQIKKIKEPVIRWPILKYRGLIQNQESQMCLVEINGNLHFMRVSETISGVRLTEAFSDSIKVELDGKSKYIRKL